MTYPIQSLAEATEQPELRVRPPSLVVALTTGMVLVDYALGGSATPTAEPRAVAERLPAELVTESHPVRAALAHGTSLRAYLVTRVPTDHPGHTDWPALRSYLAGLSDAEIHELIAIGIADVLAYQKPPGTTPTAAEIRTAVRRHGVPVLEAWQVPEPERRVAELLDAGGFRATLLALLDAVWQHWLGEAWSAQLPALRAAAAAAPAPPPGASGTQWITMVTGLRPDPAYAEFADRAPSVTVMPCPGLGRSLSLYTQRGHAWVLYTPRPAPVERTGIAVQRLGALAPALHALGDRTRLAIVLHLLEHDRLTMPQLIEALGVHQSTISRQVAALRSAGLVELDEQRRLSAHRDALRRAARTLLEALE
ncbi:MAG TPA: helix-turn-helix transcriptional regulator [Natronosporangium sp.]